MNNIFKIIKYIRAWQNDNDKDFKMLPNDEHACLIFNHKNQIYKFVFSNKYKRDKCRLSIPIDLQMSYDYMIEQEDGFTYYVLKETTNEINDDN